MKCEKHSNVTAPCCAVCLIEERDRLRKALEVMDHHVHGISGYDWNADPDNVTPLVGEALSPNAGGQRPPASGGTPEPPCSQPESKGN